MQTDLILKFNCFKFKNKFETAEKIISNDNHESQNSIILQLIGLMITLLTFKSLKQIVV